MWTQHESKLSKFQFCPHQTKSYASSALFASLLLLPLSPSLPRNWFFFWFWYVKCQRRRFQSFCMPISNTRLDSFSNFYWFGPTLFLTRTRIFVLVVLGIVPPLMHVKSNCFFMMLWYDASRIILLPNRFILIPNSNILVYPFRFQRFTAFLCAFTRTEQNRLLSLSVYSLSLQIFFKSTSLI